jgi:hypothetical protein
MCLLYLTLKTIYSLSEAQKELSMFNSYYESSGGFHRTRFKNI